MIESPTDKFILENNVNLQNKSNHIKQMSSITELYGNLRRNTLGQVFDQNYQKENLTVQFKHLSQAYDNAQQKILDLERQSNNDLIQLEESKQKLYLIEQISSLNITNLLNKINQFGIDDGQQFLTEWSNQLSQVQVISQQLKNENSVLKQLSHQFLELNGKLSEDLQQTLQELSYKSEEVIERDNQIEGLIECIEQTKLLCLEKDEELQLSLNQIQNQTDSHSKLQTQFNKISEIINQYQQSMQVVVQLMQLDNLDSVEDFSYRVEKSIKGILSQFQVLKQDNEKLIESSDKANKISKQSKQQNEQLLREVCLLQEKESKKQYDHLFEIKSINDQNSQIHRHVEQMTVNLDQEHQIRKNLQDELTKQEALAQIMKIILDKASRSLGGDYIEIFRELEDVHRQRLHNLQDVKILDARIRALNGEIDSLDCLDKKRLNMIQQLEKQNSQLKNDVQIMKNEIDLKEFKRRNSEFNTQNTLNQQSHRANMRRQGDGDDPQAYYVPTTGNKKTLNQMGVTSLSLIKNLSYQFKSLE